MTSLEKQIKSSKKWKQAEKELKEFEDMMELIKQYPPQPMKNPPPCSPYKINNSFYYYN